MLAQPSRVVHLPKSTDSQAHPDLTVIHTHASNPRECFFFFWFARLVVNVRKRGAAVQAKGKAEDEVVYEGLMLCQSHIHVYKRRG